MESSTSVSPSQCPTVYPPQQDARRSLYSSIRTQTAKNFFPTSIPAHFSTLTSRMAPPFEERPTPSSSLCLAGLKAPIGGSFYVGQATFLPGWVPPLNKPAISRRAPHCRYRHPLR